MSKKEIVKNIEKQPNFSQVVKMVKPGSGS